MNSVNRIALVTGGNKGIGFEVCRQLAKAGCIVLLGTRDIMKGQAAAEKLSKDGLNVTPVQLDVTSESDIDSVTKCIIEQFGRIDVLVNNAGILLDPPRHPPESEGASVFNASLDTIRASLETNTFGALRLCQRLVPLMIKNGYGRVVNVSSGMGQLADMEGGWPGYRISKTALNAVTRIFASETKGTNVLINSVCPGWVQTDMGGKEADLTPAEGANTIVWLATLIGAGPSGSFFQERQEISW